MTTSQLARRIVFWFLCYASIAVLLGHVYGVGRMRQLALGLLLPSAIVMVLIWGQARGANDKDFQLRIKAGLLGGLWGTMGYDLVRIPLHVFGQNPFTPIRAYGTWLWGADFSTPWSDAIGFAYHISNGITFGCIFTILMLRRHWAFALSWGLLLETLAIASAFGEVFAMRTAYSTLAAAYVAHLFYGYPLGRVSANPEHALASIRPLLGTIRGWMTLVLPSFMLVWFLTAWQPIGNQPVLHPGQIQIGPDALYPGWSDLPQGSHVEVVNRLPEAALLTIRHPGPLRVSDENLQLTQNETRSIQMIEAGVHQILIRGKPFRSIFISVSRDNDYRAPKRAGN